MGKNNRKRNRKAGKNWEIIGSGCGCSAFLRDGKGTINSPTSVVISLLLTLFVQEKMFLYEEAENRMGFPE